MASQRLLLLVLLSVCYGQLQGPEYFTAPINFRYLRLQSWATSDTNQFNVFQLMVFLTFNGTNVALNQATSATLAACCGQESFRAVSGVMVLNRYSSVRTQPLPHFLTVDLGASRSLTSGNISIYLGQTSTLLGTSYSNDNTVWHVLTPKATAAGGAGGALVTVSICPPAFYCPPELGARVLCPGGHFCPKGISSFASYNCGRGNYCPAGSAAPTPCPYQQPPPEGWDAQQAQGPAFLVETARCLNHCFWNSSSGDSNKLSTC